MDEATSQLAALFEPRIDDLRKLVEKIENLSRNQAARPNTALEIFARLWHTAREDGSLEDDRRRRILESVGSALIDVKDSRNSLREVSSMLLQDYLATEAGKRSKLRQRPPSQLAVQFERAIVGFSQIVRSHMPQEAIDEGQGTLIIDWETHPEPTYSWKHSAERYPALQIAVAAVEDYGAIGPPESRAIGQFLLSVLQEYPSLVLPSFQTFLTRNRQQETAVLWTRSVAAPDERFEPPPQEPSQECELPSDEEVQLWEQYPEVADLLCAELWKAVERDFETARESAPADESGEIDLAHQAIERLVDAIARLTKFSKEQVARLLLHLAYEQWDSAREGSHDAQGQERAIDFLVSELNLP